MTEDIITLYAFFFENVKKYKIHDETFKIQLYFDFCTSSTKALAITNCWGKFQRLFWSDFIVSDIFVT